MTQPRLPKLKILATVLTLLSTSFFLAALDLKYFIFPLALTLYYLIHLMAILLNDELKAVPANIIAFSTMIAIYTTLASITGINVTTYMDLPLMTAAWLTGTTTYINDILSKIAKPIKPASFKTRHEDERNGLFHRSPSVVGRYSEVGYSGEC